MGHGVNTEEVRDALAVGGAGLGFMAAVRRLFGAARPDLGMSAAVVRIEAKLDQVRVELADHRRAYDSGLSQIHRELEDHREEDNRRFGELSARIAGLGAG
ncbi:MAG TPA: hypothetical protein VKV28_04790 [Candidatus Binataceae bacterium]|nr:hypothetical protein [Candidatus Binataceae bacterium]